MIYLAMVSLWLYRARTQSYVLTICLEFSALGVEKALISDAQMTSSSSLDPPKTNASSGRLNFNSAWCSATSDEIPLFLQIDLGEIHFITAVSTNFRWNFQKQVWFGHRADRYPPSVIVYILLPKVLIAATVLLVIENFEWILRKKTQQNIWEPQESEFLWNVIH